MLERNNSLRESIQGIGKLVSPSAHLEKISIVPRFPKCRTSCGGSGRKEETVGSKLPRMTANAKDSCAESRPAFKSCLESVFIDSGIVQSYLGVLIKIEKYYPLRFTKLSKKVKSATTPTKHQQQSKP